ncbi:HAMP domain-containing histidine kinase [Pseudomonas guariconensis]|uniref:sensor histidine kinase n=1 Tax=Pseudomonas TaxID=286 RepID=UPI002097FD4A|nr:MULTISPECIES: HAMP domain-containing sensor histidine kinase [Pseudomonas]MCO7637276.1 HAMP domain-containing histidine kinase [Pseudomonas sp. S 311-6]MCO7517924.1 HAMP domain-containing histidine kinase [Pseudomonas putida]MCO7566919.1 HAMP domain-containing histidine kinase [Pseudomonas mosselii]MCO7592805.1 HAMP domain-containing histidine kinase [Pseudomonas guariconensis]MCO7608424.1 HAMP domain-containing histidine kinase [Pseudomonas guariconensis]
MNHNDQGLDFSTVIASTVHDMKNSLSALIQAHDQWLARLPEALRGGSEQGVMEHEFRHLNGMLVQLLGLYKLGINQLPICPDYHELDDFIEAQLAVHQEVLEHRDILATWRVDSDNPLGFFDRELVASAVSNVLTNAIRYASHALLISIEEEGEQLVISINDDGAGYPARMLEPEQEHALGIDSRTGSTGLGLHFAARIAALHERDGVRGRIEIANGGPLGGGLFRLYLP